MCSYGIHKPKDRISSCIYSIYLISSETCVYTVCIKNKRKKNVEYCIMWGKNADKKRIKMVGLWALINTLFQKDYTFDIQCNIIEKSSKY